MKFGLWLCFIFSNKSPVPEPAVNVRSGVFEQHIADRERVLEREMEREEVRMREKVREGESVRARERERERERAAY